MAGADARAPRDPGDQAVLLDLAVVVVAVAAVVGRDDEQRVAIQARGRDGVEQGAQALVGGADGLELRVRHPAVGVSEVVGVGEVNELDLGLLLDEVARRLVRRPSCRSSRAARTCPPSRGARCAPASSCRRTRPCCRRSCSAASNTRRHVDVAALGLPRVPEQAVLLDVEAGEHRRVRRQRRRAADGARLERIRGALQDLLVDGRAARR